MSDEEENFDDDEEVGEQMDDDNEEIRADELADDDDEEARSDDDDQDAEEQAEEEEEKDPDVAVTVEMMAEHLSLLCKTGDGLAHAYVRFDAADCELTDISLLASYVHLRYIDLSRNNLRDVSALNSSSHLLTIQLSNNKLTSADVPTDLPYLQAASFASNRIKSLSGISHPVLESLNLNYNEVMVISELEPDRLCRLHTLELRSNRLKAVSGLCLPSLKNLYLAANEITSVEGIDELENLTVVHLRENQLQTLDGFSGKLRHLKYINLRGNIITDVKEAKKLEDLPALKALVLFENPISDDDDYRLEVLVAVQQLDRLDKDKYSDEEKEEATRIHNERKVEEQLMAEEEMSKQEVTEETTVENTSGAVTEE